MTQKKFITSNEIVEELKNMLESNKDETFISQLPNLIMYLEANYENIRGIEKRKLVIDAILMISTNLEQSERELLTNSLIVQIDNLVHIAKHGQELFKKLKKRKCIFC